jgi:CheY-like chemotaxis protein
MLPDRNRVHAPTRRPGAAIKARPKVLVVDDDEDVQALIAGVLRDAGLTVVTASTGWDALNILERNGVDLMVTDIVLPEGIDGIELVIYARGRNPALKSLFVSGHSRPVKDDPDLDDFVAKPFRPRELLGCVYELLGRQPPKRRALNSRREALQALVKAKIECMRQQRRRVSNMPGFQGGQPAVEEAAILVVDDDPDVLEVAAAMVEDLGFRVLRAAGGIEALQLLEQDPNIMLLVTDVVMPGMDGWELVRSAKQRSPNLKVLYMSGFIKNQVSLPSEGYGPILAKPWRSEQFYLAVKRALFID